MASARTCPHRHSWYLDFQVLSGLRAFSADEEVRGPQTGGRLRHRLARSCLAQDAQRRARAASAGGRSEGCGREKRSRTSRDGLDETPDKTQRQKHRGQTDRSLRLAARRPRRSDKGQAKTVGASGKKRDSQQRKWMRAASKHGERCPPREQRPRDRAGPLPPHPATRLPLPPAPGASAEAKPAHRLGGVPLNTRGHSVTARGQDQNTTAPRSHL